MSSYIIAEMHFQGNPLACGYATAYYCVGGRRGCGVGRPAGGGLVGLFDTGLAIVLDRGAVWNYQGVLCCLFSGQETAELEEIAFYQRGVSRKVSTLHT